MKPLLEVTKTALLHDCTLLCGWRLRLTLLLTACEVLTEYIFSDLL